MNFFAGKECDIFKVSLMLTSLLRMKIKNAPICVRVAL